MAIMEHAYYASFGYQVGVLSALIDLFLSCQGAYGPTESFFCCFFFKIIFNILWRLLSRNELRIVFDLGLHAHFG